MDHVGTAMGTGGGDDPVRHTQASGEIRQPGLGGQKGIRTQFDQAPAPLDRMNRTAEPIRSLEQRHAQAGPLRFHQPVGRAQSGDAPADHDDLHRSLPNSCTASTRAMTWSSGVPGSMP